MSSPSFKYTDDQYNLIIQDENSDGWRIIGEDINSNARFSISVPREKLPFLLDVLQNAVVAISQTVKQNSPETIFRFSNGNSVTPPPAIVRYRSPSYSPPPPNINLSTSTLPPFLPPDSTSSRQIYGATSPVPNSSLTTIDTESRTSPRLSSPSWSDPNNSVWPSFDESIEILSRPYSQITTPQITTPRITTPRITTPRITTPQITNRLIAPPTIPTSNSAFTERTISSPIRIPKSATANRPTAPIFYQL